MKHKASKRDLGWSENDLIKSMSRHKLNSEFGEGEKIFNNYFKINNEKLSAKKVADIIKEKFDLEGGIV